MPNPTIFISYAREQGQIAGRLAHLLIGRKYDVFFDSLSLRVGSAWDEKIIEQINQADLFIFLISPDSVAPNSFCHNELAVAKKRWPSPEGRILPIIVVPTNPDLIDPYILAAKIEEPRGDPAVATAWLTDLMLAPLRGLDPDQSQAAPKGTDDISEAPPELDNVRSFIQRAEVRLSTMHRVAGSFVSGAGLVVLLPFLLRDATVTMVEFSAKSLSSTGLGWQSLASAWIIAFAAAIYLTFVSLYFLLRDLIRFYFVPHSQDEGHLFPRYAISALSYPSPKNDPTKQLILQALYSSRIYKFGMHRNQRSIEFYELVDKEYDFVKPETREEFERLSTPGEHRDLNERHLYNVACGIAGISERTIIEEAARLEASLVRHNTGLRGIVIRYAKALLLTLWTSAFIMFVIAVAKPLLEGGTYVSWEGVPHAVPLGILLSAAVLIWALVSTRLVKHPLYWISEMAEVVPRKRRKAAIIDHDPQFKQFEDHVRWSCRIAWGCCLVSLVSIGYWLLLQRGLA